jgi:hypothetical protein
MHTIQIQKLYKLQMAGTPQQLKPITAGPRLWVTKYQDFCGISPE